MGKGDGGLTDILMLGVVVVGGYYLYKEGIVGQVFDELTKAVGSLPGLPSLPGLGTGAGGGAAAGGSTGSCSGGPYKEQEKQYRQHNVGPRSRHYASGKADTTTIEKNAQGIKFKNYQFVSYVTLKKVGSDDNISVKIGGSHNNGGWYDHGVSFKGGQTCLGTEKKHPSTNSCVVKGKSIGSVVGKKIGVAGVMINGKTEIWTDTGGGWQLGASAMNPDGFKQLTKDNEVQLRIDDAPQLDIHCSNVQEIAAGATAASGYASYATNIETNTLPPLQQDIINYRYKQNNKERLW